MVTKSKTKFRVTATLPPHGKKHTKYYVREANAEAYANGLFMGGAQNIKVKEVKRDGKRNN